MTTSKRTLDSAARTARLHPSTPHRKPYRREFVPCLCGGVPQPPSSREASKAKRLLAAAVRRSTDRTTYALLLDQPLHRSKADLAIFEDGVLARIARIVRNEGPSCLQEAIEQEQTRRRTKTKTVEVAPFVPLPKRERELSDCLRTAVEFLRNTPDAKTSEGWPLGNFVAHADSVLAGGR